MANIADRRPEHTDRSVELRGGCLCQSVSFRLVGRLTSFYLCFCSQCQKASGSSNAANLFVEPSRFELNDEMGCFQEFELSPETYFNKAFCSNCGSPLPCNAKSGDFIIVPAGILDTEVPADLDRVIHWHDRPRWHAGAHALWRGE